MFTIKRIVIQLLRFYQRILSPDRGFLRYFLPYRGGYCRMEPSCSEYMILAVEKYGVMRGIIKGIGRIFRCHPWQKKYRDIP